MDAYKKFGGTFSANDKVKELKDVLKGHNKVDPESSDKDQETSIMNTPTEEFGSVEQQAQIEKLEKKLADVESELEKKQLEAKNNKDEVLRTIAEFDNTRKRLKRESEELARYANEKLLMEFLPIIDNLEMSLQHVKPSGLESETALIEGIRLTLKQFLATLEKFGLSAIEGLGAPFNPNTQEAIGVIETPDVPDGCVAQVHRRGYRLHERVIRPAMVSISKALM